MGTLSEQILCGTAGEYVDRIVDRAYVHDGTGVLTLEAWKSMGARRIQDAANLHVLFDHIVPANNSTTATLQRELREFACSSFLNFSDIGGGICHQVMSEGVVLPGEVVVGADSHSCTLGAFGAFATGVGSYRYGSDLDDRGDLVPRPGIDRHSPFREVSGSELRQKTSHSRTSAGSEWMVLPTRLWNLLVKARQCYLWMIASRSVTFPLKQVQRQGCFTPMILPCSTLKRAGHTVQTQQPGPCTYIKEIDFDLSDIVPVIALPPRVDTIKPVHDLAGLPLDQVFVGTCTNGRYSDLARFAQGVKGRKVAIRTIVVPASRAVPAESDPDRGAC